MTDQELNIALAEWAGWKQTSIYNQRNPQDLIWLSPASEKVTESLLPNYTGDLNAVHELVERLNDDQQDDYDKILWHLTQDENDFDLSWMECFGDRHAFANATARQRAEAFAKTLGVWKEET